MKRIISYLLSALMSVSLLFGAFTVSVAERGVHSVGSLRSSAVDVFICEETNVTFTADISSAVIFKASGAALYEDDTKIASMYDNGSNGDEKGNDNVYTASVTLFSNYPCTKKYVVKLGDSVSSECEITFCKRVSDSDFVQHDALWDEIRSFESTKSFESDAEVTKQLYSFVESKEYIDSISWDSDYSFSFVFDSGIHSAYVNWEMKNKLRSADGEADDVFTSTMSEKAVGDYATWEDPDFLTLRPFRNTPSQGDFANEFYSGIARSVCQKTGGNATDLIESSACPAALLTVHNYGFFIVDSHGELSGGRSYMVLRKGNTSSYDYNTDVSAGHIVTYDTNTVGVTGSFLTKHYNSDPNSLPGTFFYLVICYGVASTALYSPLLSLGAKLVVGYTNSVSFTYDFAFSEDVWNYMLRTCATDDKRTYSYEEARVYSVGQNGQSDYSSGAAQRSYGDNTLCLVYDPYTAAQTLSLSTGSCELYINNGIQLNAVVTPQDASCYSLSWRSDNSSVAAVTSEGYVTAVSTGVAKITCSLVDEVDPQNNKTAECTINVLGELHVTGIEVDTESLEIYTAGESKLTASVIPSNASNQKLLFESSDETIATVTADGIVRGISAGYATITITSDDGGFKKLVSCKVSMIDFSGAVNAMGGGLEFVNTSAYPWKLDFVDDRIAIVSTNVGINSSSCMLTITKELVAGSVVRFDWKTSCEQRFDTLSFKVNGQETSGIPAISGNTNWTTTAYTVQSNGTYSFSWSYTKDTSILSGEDRAWLDNIDISSPNETHTVRFFDMSGSVVSTEQVAHGAAATAPTLAPVPGYTFTGWDNQYAQIRVDMDIHPIYVESGESFFVVTFCDEDGTVIETVSVSPNTAATPPTPPTHEGKLFIGWDTDFSNVGADMTVTAVYGILGDANFDSLLNTGDAVTILRYSVSLITLDDTKKLLADYNGDGLINTGDAVGILVYVVT